VVGLSWESWQYRANGITFKPKNSRLLAWITIYEGTLNGNDPTSSGFRSEEAREAFEQEGISIWHQLRQELAPDYEVRYFSQKLRKAIGHPNELMTMV
jgi:hypothetical protein